MRNDEQPEKENYKKRWSDPALFLAIPRFIQNLSVFGNMPIQQNPK